MEETKFEVDLRALEFASTIDDNLLCSVCHCPFIKPIITAECEHIFCGDCFESSSSSSSSSQQTATTCPFCRTMIDSQKIRKAPRAFSNMADDLKVRCPLWKIGCDVISTRGSVQSHLEKYCGYAELDCLGRDCAQKSARRELALGCRHHLVDCRDCHDSIMALRLEEHREKKCPNRWTSCVECGEEILRCKLEDHSSVCPEAIVECPGRSIGCKDMMKRSEIRTHKDTCTFATLEPIFRRQDEQLKAIEADNHLLRRKIASLGDASFTTVPMSSQRNSTGSETRLPPLSSFPIDTSPDVDPVHATTPDNPPFDSAVHHLLSSYESLRLDIDRILASINELDARQSMMFMNESLRVKEDFSHLNAIVGAMRIQLHWLMTTRLQSQQRAGAMTGPNNSPASAGGAGYGNAGSSLSMLGSQSLRRLSGMVCVSQIMEFLD